MFDKDKEKYLAELGKPDRSKKGGVDEAAWPVLDAINSRKDLYTTSSCAGRTSLFVEPPDGRKDHGNWHYVTHDENKFDELMKSITELPDGKIWFMFEAAIFHVVARDEKSANKFLQVARECGFKHSGILGTKKRWMIEIIDSEKIHLPIAIDKNIFVTQNYVALLCKEANEKLLLTRKKMKKLSTRIQDDFRTSCLEESDTSN